jgi:hypothetical protein
LAPIFGTVSAQPSIGFDYDYDGNIQRGGSSAGTNAPFTAVALDYLVHNMWLLLDLLLDLLQM